MSLNQKMFLMGLAGCESMEDGEHVGDVVPADLPTTPEEVEDQSAELAISETNVEVVELAKVVEDVIDQVEELQDDQEELEETVAGLEAFMAKGDYHPVVAALLYDKARTIDAKLNNGKAFGEFVGAEALGDATTAQMAMRAGMESFLATAKKYAAAAAEYIKTIFNNAIAFIKSIFNKAEGIKRRAAALVKAIAAKDELKEEITLGKWNTLVDYEGTSDDAAGQMKGKIEKILASMKSLTDSKDRMISNMAEKKEDVSSFAGLYSSLVGDLKALVTAGATAKESKNGNKTTVTATAGGSRYIMTYFGGEIKSYGDVKNACKVTRVSAGTVASDKIKTSGTVKSKYDKSKLTTLVTQTSGFANLRSSDIFNDGGRNKVIGSINQLAGKDNPLVGKLISAVKSMYAMASSVESAVNKHYYNTLEARLQCAKAHL